MVPTVVTQEKSKISKNNFLITKVKIPGNDGNLKIETPHAEHFLCSKHFQILTPWGTCNTAGVIFFGKIIIFGITNVKILGNGEKLKIETPRAEHFSCCDLFRILTPWGTYRVKSKTQNSPKFLILKKSKF